jgi:hypothetical protein
VSTKHGTQLRPRRKDCGPLEPGGGAGREFRGVTGSVNPTLAGGACDDETSRISAAIILTLPASVYSTALLDHNPPRP